MPGNGLKRLCVMFNPVEQTKVLMPVPLAKSMWIVPTDVPVPALTSRVE